MASKDAKRKMAAILMADVVGYSRLMGQDEQATLHSLTDCRKVFIRNTAGHNGRVVNTPGDSVLAEFTSVVDAVSAAAEIQRELAEYNEGNEPHRKMEYRIGINLGDVMVRGDEIHGDGVNIAARLEAIADPGGICISGTVFDHVEGKLPLSYEFLGEKRVKNIAKAVRAYRVVSHPGAAAHRASRAFHLGMRKGRLIGLSISAIVAALLVAAGIYYLRPGMDAGDAPPGGSRSAESLPSIAVLPFDNLSGDPEQGYFADGMSEEIIAKLSRFPNLMVIARNSSFKYKGQAVDIREVGRDLGVGHVLEGSVRRSGDRVRVTIQLIETQTGKHLWSEQYDRPFSDTLAMQGEIAWRVTQALLVTIIEGDQARTWNRETENAEAYDYFIRGRHPMVNSPIGPGWLKARELHKKALELDPEYAAAHAHYAWTFLYGAVFGYDPDPQGAMARARELLDDGLERFPNSPDMQRYAGDFYHKTNDLKKALEHKLRSLNLDPNCADCAMQLAWTYWALGDAPRGLAAVARGKSLNPFPLPWYNAIHGGLLLTGEHYQEAVDIHGRCISWEICKLGLLLALSGNGEEGKARELARSYRRENPGLFYGSYLLQVGPNPEFHAWARPIFESLGILEK